MTEENNTFITAKEYGERLVPPVSPRRARAICEAYQDTIHSIKVGPMWVVPENAIDPRDQKHVP